MQGARQRRVRGGPTHALEQVPDLQDAGAELPADQGARAEIMKLAERGLEMSPPMSLRFYKYYRSKHFMSASVIACTCIKIYLIVHHDARHDAPVVTGSFASPTRTPGPILY